MEPEIPELIELERELGSRSLIEYTRMAWPHVEPAQPLVEGWHLGLLAEHYEACFRGEITSLVVNLPPGMTKSRLTCVFFPTWVWAKAPHLRFINASYSPVVVRRDAKASTELMQGEWWRNRWGATCTLPSIVAVDNIENLQRGWRLATTPGSLATGFHANFQIIDDPIKPEDLTDVKLETCKNWIKGTMASRWQKPGLNCRILIMQRLHCDDLAAYMLAEDPDVVHINLPMRYEPVVRCETKWGVDQREKEGELICPDRFDEKAVKKMERDMGGLVAAAQLQQRPVPEGGHIFKTENMRKYWRAVPAKYMQAVQSWDCAFKETKDSDFVVGQVWYRIGGEYYLVDQIRGRMSFTETLAAIRRMTKKWPRVIAKLIEDKANGSAVVDTLKKEISGIIEVNPEGGKVARANAVAPLFEAGNVWLPDPTMEGFDWVDGDYKPELSVFPMGRKDDQVDATTQALLYLHQKRSYLDEAMKKFAEEQED